MSLQLRGTQNSYSFTITREEGNRYFTFISNHYMKAEYYTYGTANTIKKLYKFIGDPKKINS